MDEKDLNNTQENENVDYIQAIQELKNSTVPREQYSKLKEENSKLLKSLINGDPLEASQVPQKETIEELRKELYGGNGFHGSDIDYVKKTLQLRQALIDAGEPDPMVGNGHKFMPDNIDMEAADRVAEGMQSFIDFADGDNGVFLAEINRRTIDVAPLKAKKK